MKCPFWCCWALAGICAAEKPSRTYHCLFIMDTVASLIAQLNADHSVDGRLRLMEKNWLAVEVQLWMWDRNITSFMVSSMAVGSNTDLRSVFLWLEWSLHGALWLIISSLGFLIAMRYNFSLGTTHSIAVLLLGLCVDLVIVGIIKGIVRRPRPEYNVKDQFYEAPVVDKFSFPSGHSSRAAMLAVLCLSLCSVPDVIGALIKLFPFVLGVSRVLMGRHYVSDVIAGLSLGYAEGNLVQVLPLNSIILLKEMFPAMFGESRN